MGGSVSVQAMSQFQNQKVTYEFRQYFDFNKDGKLNWNDFVAAKEKMCKMSGWKRDGPEYVQMESLFVDLWKHLNREQVDENDDNEISEIEWCKMWDSFYNRILKEKLDAEKEKKEYEFKVPSWLERYVEYKYNLLDRTKDNEVDIDEFEYVMEDFGVKPREAKAAFKLFTNQGEKKLDKALFRELYVQYFLSDDMQEPGNYITGKLSFDDIEPKYTPSIEEQSTGCL